MYRKGFAPILIILIIVAVLAVGGGALYVGKKKTAPPITPKPQPQPQQPVACTQEARQCPDGSYVGRTGPNCEFAACPQARSTSTQDVTAGTQIFSPEEVLARKTEFNGKIIQIRGKLSLIPFVDTISGLGGAGPGFQTAKGTIKISGLQEVYNAITAKKTVVVRGTYNAKNSFLDLETPSNCKDCVRFVESATDTSTWQTYIADVGYGRYGFRFSYPNEWNIQDSQAGMGASGLRISSPKRTEMSVDTIDMVVSYGYSINNVEAYSITEKNLQEHVNTFRAQVTDFAQQPIVIDGISATRLSGFESANPNLKGTRRVDVSFLRKIDNKPKKNNAIYYLSYRGVNGDYEKEFNQVLSTFRFIKPSSTIGTSN